MSDIENLRNHLMHLTARVGAIESITRTFVALICSYDNRPEALDRLNDSVFPLLVRQAEEKKYPGTPQALADWLVNQEVQIVKAEIDAIREQIDLIRKKSYRNIQ